MPASFDRLVNKIKEGYVKRGYSVKEATRIAFATATKMRKKK